MAETQVLRSSAIVQNAAVGTSKPPLVSAGALPLVQVKMTPAGPQIREGQQRPVQMLPPNSRGASVQAGALPMVQVKMTQNGPQPDDGQNRSVVIKDSRQNAINAGGLPMVQVRMDGGKPQVQTVPNVQGAPPQIPAAAPVLSQPRVARIAAPRQVQVYPRQVAQPQVVQVQQALASQMPELSIDQVLFVRHVVDKYLSEHTGNVAADSTTANNLKIAEDAALVLDRMLAVATAQAAEIPVVEIPVEIPVEAPAVAAVPVTLVPAARPAAVGYVAPAAYSSTMRPAGRYVVPTGGYVAPRADGRRINVPASMRTGNATLAPRRVARAGQAGGLPMVQVKMDGQRAVVQNQAEVAAAKQALIDAELQAQAEALVAATPAPAPVPAAPTVTVVAAPPAAAVETSVVETSVVEPSAPEAPPSSAPQAAEGGGQS